MQEGHPVEVDAACVAERRVLGLDLLELRRHVVLVREQHVLGMLEVAHEDVGARGRMRLVSEPYPQVPVGELEESLVEAREPSDEVGAHDDVGAACREGRPREKLVEESVGIGEHERIVDDSFLGHGDDTSVREAGARLPGRVDLTPELVRGPHVVVVEERDPLAAGGGDTRVSRPCDPEAPLMPDDSQPRLGQLGQPCVVPSREPSSTTTTSHATAS